MKKELRNPNELRTFFIKRRWLETVTDQERQMMKSKTWVPTPEQHRYLSAFVDGYLQAKS